MPMLALHADTYPFELVIEVLISFINPRPDLFLYVTVTVVSFTASILQNKSIEIRIQPAGYGGPMNATGIREKTNKKLPGNMRFGGTRMSSKKSRRTGSRINTNINECLRARLILFMPYSEALLIWPRTISPLNGRKTIRRNSTTKCQRCTSAVHRFRRPLTLTMPVP